MDWRIQRITQAIVTVWLVMTLSFFLIRFMPGSPMD
jgi:peptide/nickel transport system permease protein